MPHKHCKLISLPEWLYIRLRYTRDAEGVSFVQLINRLLEIAADENYISKDYEKASMPEGKAHVTASMLGYKEKPKRNPYTKEILPDYENEQM